MFGFIWTRAIFIKNATLRGNASQWIQSNQSIAARAGSYFELSTDEGLEEVYSMRTRVEENYVFNDVQFSLGCLHSESVTMLRLTLLLANCLATLIPLTAFKIGRPNLMWAPTAFQANTIHSEEFFTTHYWSLVQMRFDDDLAPSPLQKRRERAKYRRDWSKRVQNLNSGENSLTIKNDNMGGFTKYFILIDKCVGSITF